MTEKITNRDHIPHTVVKYCIINYLKILGGVMSKELIVKHNKLIEANYKLTLQEQKLIFVLSSFIEKDEKKFKKCIFEVGELVKMLGLSKNFYYSELKEITKSLISRVIQIKEPDGLLQMSWLSSAKYYDGSTANPNDVNDSLK